MVLKGSLVCLLCFLCLLCLRRGVGQELRQQRLVDKLLCIEHARCGACLAAAAHCRWCADPYYSSAAPRCNDYDSLVSAGCSQALVQKPPPSSLQVTHNESLQDVAPGGSAGVVQLQPQRLELTLRPRQTQKISFRYRPARNYPLDLYYLMDLTWSMKDDKETLVALRDDLPAMLQNLTDNFRDSGQALDSFEPFVLFGEARASDQRWTLEPFVSPNDFGTVGDFDEGDSHELPAVEYPADPKSASSSMEPAVTLNSTDSLPSRSSLVLVYHATPVSAEPEVIDQGCRSVNRIGFGSFAEKPIMPFISIDPTRRANPCAVEEQACESTYSFRHHLSLTNQVQEFIQHVNSSSVTANLDNAEAQLDALMQVLQCTARVGWAGHSRKIVLLLSDGLLHFAGDGKLGGAIRRNDEECHLDENGYYSEAGVYDYPTLAQIYRLLGKRNVNVIFAVTESVKGHYDSLHKVLEDFTHIAKLESDSSNILKLVESGYEAIISVVNFKDNSSDGPVKVKYFTDCGVPGGLMIETTRCSGVKYGMTLNYEAHVTLDACPEFKSSSQTITISESQLGADSLTLQVALQCGCACDGAASSLEAACPLHSHLVCGVCQCDQGWSGPKCDCSTSDEAASAALSAQCREPNATRWALCSGTGDCVCGECQCDPGWSGRFCQCKACELSRDNGLECGGASRGVCACGACACAAGWAGAACDCSRAQDACRAPGDEDACSGRGDCVCGKCQCSTANDVAYTGRYCETCATCDNPLCADAEPCVVCKLSGNCSDVCVTPAANYTVTEDFDSAATKDETWCVLRVEQDESTECEYQYTYSKGSRSMVLMDIVVRSRECHQPTSATLVSSALVIMGCVVLAGLIVIIAIKLAQVTADRRAYAKFRAEAERSMLQMNEQNPLYISPISEFKLPDSFPRDKFD